MKNFKRALGAVMACTVLSVNLQAGDVPPGKDKVVIAGQIDGLPATNAHFAELWVMRKTPFVANANNMVKRLPVDENGKFNWVLDSIREGCHIEIRFVDDVQHDEYFINRENVFIEPGDNFFIKGTWNQQDGAPLHATITGKGAAKFKCLQEIDAAQLDKEDGVSYRLWKEKVYLGLPKILSDSILSPKMAILNKYKGQLTKEEYETIRANIEANLIPVYSFMPNSKRDTEANALSLKKKGFAELQVWIQAIKPTSEMAICQSQNYIRFLIFNEETKVCLDDNSETPDFAKVYQALKTGFTGQVREKLLTQYLLDQERDSVIPEVYDQSLKDALTLVNTDYLKAGLEFKTRLGKGGIPYDFTMTIDSSDRMLSLSDLKGDVVLIDEWSYACGACVNFAHTFHDKVYSLFKDDPHFKVVSIFGSYGSGHGNKVDYMRRLHNVDEKLKPCPPENSSSFPDYINLYGGNGVVKGAEAMGAYYRTHSAPFILLVGKNGRIIASTATSFPFCEYPESPNVDKLIAMIKTALAENFEKKQPMAIYH